MSNKSLVQIVMALQSRVAALEEAVRQQRFVTHTPGLAVLAPTVPSTPLPQPSNTGRAMCPKCGVKPNHFFHVKTCAGKKEEQKDADTIRRRDQGTP